MSQPQETLEAGRSTPKKVIVIGSGIAGLLTAQGLLKNGFDVTVYERDPSLEYKDNRPVSFMIHWGFETLETILPPALWSSIHTTYCNPAQSTYQESEGITFLNGHSGEVLFQAPPAVMRRVTRQKMRKLISQGVDIRWNMRFDSLTPSSGGGVTVKFEDGTSAIADVVVGADGARSKVRQALLGAEQASVTKSDFVCGYSSAVVGKENAEAVYKSHPVWTMAYHSMGVCAIGVEDVKDPDDKSTWVFNITRIWRGDSPRIDGNDAIDVMKNNTATFCEPFKSAVEAIPEESPAFVRSLYYWRPVPWPNHGGSVTLAGDAAHPMLPFRGQGLNHAMDDALKIVEAVKDAASGTVSLKESIDRYDADVVQRGASAVDTAVKEGTLVQDMDRLTEMMVAKRGVAKG